ncbi:Tn3 family transposase [Streptomyces gardneri]|nr:Tn3 family transposase [Streptomyces gardneri]CUM44123.1 hypothetical protein BN2537_17211 [Streptomyces venezuelae]
MLEERRPGRAYDLLRMFGREGRPTQLGQAFMEYGRIAKTLHLLVTWNLDRDHVPPRPHHELRSVVEHEGAGCDGEVHKPPGVPGDKGRPERQSSGLDAADNRLARNMRCLREFLRRPSAAHEDPAELGLARPSARIAEYLERHLRRDGPSQVSQIAAKPVVDP